MPFKLLYLIVQAGEGFIAISSLITAECGCVNLIPIFAFSH